MNLEHTLLPQLVLLGILVALNPSPPLVCHKFKLSCYNESNLDLLKAQDEWSSGQNVTSPRASLVASLLVCLVISV